MSLIPLVPITLDRTRGLRYTMASLTRVEGLTGKPFGALVSEQMQGSMTALVHIVWAGLVHEDPKLTPDKVAAAIDLHALEPVSLAVAQAIRLAFGKDDDAADGAPPDDVGNGAAPSVTG
jgi:hypothetical protein